jgi:hypothetical protein
VGIVSLMAFCYFPYEWAKENIDWFAGLFGSKENFILIFMPLGSFFFYAFLNLIYLVIYLLNWQFFEQYKDNDVIFNTFIIKLFVVKMLTVILDALALVRR